MDTDGIQYGEGIGE